MLEAAGRKYGECNWNFCGTLLLVFAYGFEEKVDGRLSAHLIEYLQMYCWHVRCGTSATCQIAAMAGRCQGRRCGRYLGFQQFVHGVRENFGEIVGSQGMREMSMPVDNVIGWIYELRGRRGRTGRNVAHNGCTIIFVVPTASNGNTVISNSTTSLFVCKSEKFNLTISAEKS